MKSSEARRIRKSISEQYPDYDEQFDAIFKKKAPMHVAKWYGRRADAVAVVASDARLLMARSHNHVQLIADENNVIWFFSYRKSEFIPTLRTLHRCSRACFSVCCPGADLCSQFRRCSRSCKSIAAPSSSSSAAPIS